MKKILLAILMLSAIIAHAQHERIDSLNLILQSLRIDDTLRVTTLNELGMDLLKAGDNSRSLKVAEEMRNLSENLAYQNGIGWSYIIAGQNFLRLSKYDSALHLFQKAVVLFDSLNISKHRAEAHLSIGQAYDFLTQYKKALIHYDIAALLSKSLETTVQVKVYNNIGVTYSHIGNYQLALENYLHASRLIPASEVRFSGVISNNIGVIYQDLQQYDEALKHFLIFLEKGRLLGEQHFVAMALFNVGETKKLMGEFAEAETFLKEVLTIHQQVGDNRGLALTFYNLGEIYAKAKDFSASEGMFRKALHHASLTGNDEVVLKTSLGVADLFIVKKDYISAKKYIDQALTLTTRITSKKILEEAYLKKSKLDSARGDYQSAYASHRRYTLLKDSLLNEKNSRQIILMSELYENEKKDKEIVRLSEAKNREALQKANDQKLFLVLASFLALIIITLIAWVYVINNHSKRLKEEKLKVSSANEQLEKLIDKIEIQNKALVQKNEKLEELHLEKDGLIGIVAHDLRSPLNQVKGLSGLLPHIGSLNKDQTDILVNINKVCERGTNLIQDLIDINQYEASEKSMISLLELNPFLQGFGNDYCSQLAHKNITLQIELATTIGVSIATNADYLRRIIDNLITNCIKFSPPGKSIYLETTHDPATNHVKIKIADEGPGFSQGDLPHLFKKFKKLSARPTAGESSTGLGLSIVKTLVDKLGGLITVESLPGRGATFMLSLPVFSHAMADRETHFHSNSIGAVK